MEKKLLIILLCILCKVSLAQTSYTTIPDPNFEKALAAFDDIPEDGKVPTAKIREIKTLSISAKGITDISGIEDFINLETLGCNENLLTTLDLSANSNLKILSCSANRLSQLDLSTNTKLQSLSCIDNQLTVLNLKNENNSILSTVVTLNNPNLRCILIDNEDLAIQGQGVYSAWTKDGFSRYTEDCNVDVTKRYTIIPDPEFEKALVSFDNITGIGDGLIPTANIKDVKRLIFNGAITDITGIEGFEALEFLGFKNTELVTIDLSSNTMLKELICVSGKLEYINLSGNSLLEALSCSGNSITTLDLSNNPKLKILKCNQNELTAINLSNTSSLEELLCANNKLNTLKISTNTALRILNCTANYIQNFDSTANLKLEILAIAGNQIKELDITNNTSLQVIDFSSNQVARFDPTKNTELNRIECRGNLLQTLDLSKNGKMEKVTCRSNKLHFINAQNNTTSTSFEIDSRSNSPSLCIQVDHPEAATNKQGIYANWKEDVTTSYSENCNLLGVADINTHLQVKIYPNPSSGVFGTSGDLIIDQIEVISSTGNSMQIFDFKKSKAKNIDISNLPKGIYFLKINSQKGTAIKKILLN